MGKTNKVNKNELIDKRKRLTEMKNKKKDGIKKRRRSHGMNLRRNKRWSTNHVQRETPQKLQREAVSEALP